MLYDETILVVMYKIELIEHSRPQISLLLLGREQTPARYDLYLPSERFAKFEDRFAELRSCVGEFGVDSR